jgi:nitrogen regulatory protein PII
MKMIVAVVETARQSEVIALLQRLSVNGYSVIPSVFGKGETGAHFGNRTFPGENSMVMALVPKAGLDGLGEALRAFADGLLADEAFKVIALDADVLV